MSINTNYLHSHSGIEREIHMEKRFVLIDEKFNKMFVDCGTELVPYYYQNKKFYKVPIMAFVNKGGIFRNFYS